MSQAARPRKNPIPEPRPGKLPQAEIQTLADHALQAWETGLVCERADSLGGGWTFLPVRDPQAALELVRSALDAEPRRSRVSQVELGTEHARHLLASRVLALAEPVT